MDAGLDQNEAELGVRVLAVALEVLADSDGLVGKHVSGRDSKKQMMQNKKRDGNQEHACAYLLDQEVKVLGELGSEACIFQNLSVSLVPKPNRGLATGAFLLPE